MNNSWDTCLTCGHVILPENMALGYSGPYCCCSEAPRVRRRSSMNYNNASSMTGGMASGLYAPVVPKHQYDALLAQAKRLAEALDKYSRNVIAYRGKDNIGLFGVDHGETARQTLAEWEKWKKESE